MMTLLHQKLAKTSLVFTNLICSTITTQ